MTKVYFENGVLARTEGSRIRSVVADNETINFYRDDFLLFGDIAYRNINLSDASINAKNARFTNQDSFVNLQNSKIENVDANWIWLWDNSTILNSSANELETTSGNNTIDGIVSAKVVEFYKNSTFTIAKNAVLKVPNKSILDFSKISGDGKIYDEQENAYYDTNNKLLDYEIDLSTLNNGDGSEGFSFNGSTLILNEGYEFTLSGDKPVFITNNAVILKADISGAKLQSINGSGSIKELHLSGNAHFSLNCELEKAVIEKGSMLYLYKEVDFGSISGGGYVNINGVIYDTNGNAMNGANLFEKTAMAYNFYIANEIDTNSFQKNKLKYNYTMATAIEKLKEKKSSYIDTGENQNYNVDLLNQELASNDNLI